MEAYTGFAQVYDEFMDNIDYQSWCEYIIKILKQYGIDSEGGNKFGNNIVLDLGCGTGNITEILAKEGYDMIGVDNSYDMLNIAMSKRKNDEILYLLQDMCELELYGTVAAAVSVCDSINYVIQYDDLVNVFKHVNTYLDPGGIFVFDLKTPHYFKCLGDNIIAEDREECSFIWDNYFNEEEHINEYFLSVFVKEEDGRYSKYCEEHYQRAYSMEDIKSALEEAGLQFLKSFEAFTETEAKEEDDRIYIIAKECMKEK